MPRSGPKIVAAALFLALFGAGFAAGVGVDALPPFAQRADAAAPGPQTLQIIPAGPGTVKYSPGGGNPSSGCNTDGASQVAAGGNAFSAVDCKQTYTPNETVTLEAIPRQPEDGRVYSFAGWSADECGGQNPCRLVMPDGPLTISAIFTPAEFGVWITERPTVDGSVTGTARPAGKALACTKDPTPACRGWYPVGTEITLTANPGSGTFTGWHRSCSGKETTCVVTTAGYGWANAEFNGAGAADIPDRVQVLVNVVLTGASGGRVVSSRSPNFGEAVDCPPTCHARFYQGEPVTLMAAGTAELAGWGGACAGRPRSCRIHAGLRNPVRATFAPAQSPTTTATTATTSMTTTTTTTTTTTGTTTDSRPWARLLGVGVGIQRGRRVVVATLRLERAARGRIVLVRGTRTLVSNALALSAGRHRVKLLLARRVRPGWTMLRIPLQDAGANTLVLTRPVRLR